MHIVCTLFIYGIIQQTGSSLGIVKNLNGRFKNKRA